MVFLRGKYIQVKQSTPVIYMKQYLSEDSWHDSCNLKKTQKGQNGNVNGECQGLPEGGKEKIFDVAKAHNNRSIGGSEQRDPLPCPRAFYVSVENAAAENGIDCGSTCRNFSKSNVDNTRNEKSRAGRVFYLPALLCTILVQDGKEGDADAL